MRKYYLDRIRSATVILVLVYHVFYLYNNVGVLGAIGGQPGVPAFDALLYFVYPWFMTLLFVIAGMSARYALQTKSPRQFLRGRVDKLLVPSTLGLLAFQWITGVMNLYVSGALSSIPPALIYPVSVLSGIGPLWFIQMLFLFSLLIVLLRRMDKSDRLWNFAGRANFAVVCLLAFLVWGAAQILNTPLITTYRFGIYGLCFLLGYYLFSHDAVQDKLARYRVPLLAVALAAGIGYTVYYYGADYTSAEVLGSLFTNLYLWVAILAILGCGKAWMNRETKLSAYMNRAGFGLYILHYPIVLGACALLHYRFNLAPAVNYALALALELILTPLLYELIRRIPVLRFWVLGIRKKKTR